ncbi:MAG: nitrogenase component 1 [Thermoplasmata archaeon]|nr:nitrogenase component 1 [Thermoplasmata archaeon]
MRLEPDGLLGAIAASESLGLTDTMVNGAGGCRSRAQIALHDMIPEYSPENPACCSSKYFSRQSRLPCTYLNRDDIVFGASGKISEGLSSVSAASGRRALLVDTLGASLVCTDYSGLTGSAGSDPVLIDGDLSSMTFGEGFDAATLAVLREMSPEHGEDGTVNILGYGVSDLGWGAGSDSLAAILGAMGVRARFVSCLSDDVAGCGRASLNVMLRPENCHRTAEWMRSEYGIPCLRPSAGAPVGYDATRSLVREVAGAVGCDPAPALEMIDADARRVHAVLMNYDRAPIMLYLKGLAIEAESSTAWPILKWMHGTFGMAPRRITLADSEYEAEIRGYLDGFGIDAIDDPDPDFDVLFSDGLRCLEGRLAVDDRSYVEVRMPRGRNLDLMGRTVIGTAGCRYVLDELMNGMVRFRCGQPTEVDYRPCCGR